MELSSKLTNFGRTWSNEIVSKNREQRRKISITTKTQFATIARSVASRICVPNKTDYDYPGTLSLIKSRIRDVRTSASLYTALFTQIMSQAGLANNKNFLVLAEMNFWFCEMNLGQVGVGTVRVLYKHGFAFDKFNFILLLIFPK